MRLTTIVSLLIITAVSAGGCSKDDTDATASKPSSQGVATPVTQKATPGGGGSSTGGALQQAPPPAPQ